MSSGDALYRRSVYTFWKRTAPPPSMQLFNAPSRETTTVQRERSNTPLQALVVMNDPQFLEAARHLAVNALKRRGDEVDAAIDELGMHVLARRLDAEEHTILRGALDTHLAQFERAPEAATTMLAVGASAVDGSIPAPKQAAWMMLATAILNLDEALNK
jgi:hypothetical protein